MVLARAGDTAECEKQISEKSHRRSGNSAPVEGPTEFWGSKLRFLSRFNPQDSGGCSTSGLNGITFLKRKSHGLTPSPKASGSLNFTGRRIWHDEPACGLGWRFRGGARPVVASS